MKTFSMKLSEELLAVAMTTVEQAIKRRKNRILQINEILNDKGICRVGWIQIESDQLPQDLRDQLTNERELKKTRIEVLERLLVEFQKTGI